MPKVTIIDQAGQVHELEAIEGASVMETARLVGIMGIEAVCGGTCACATCHVHVSPGWTGITGKPSTTEAEILEFAQSVTECSRLSCQLRMTEARDGLQVRIPQKQE